MKLAIMVLFYFDYNYQKNYDRLNYIVDNEVIYAFGIANITKNSFNLGQQIYTLNANISSLISNKNYQFNYQDILKIPSISYLINLKIIGKESNSIYLSGGYMPTLGRNAEYEAIIIKTDLNGKIDETFGRGGFLDEKNINLNGGINHAIISNKLIFTAQTLKVGNSINGVIVSYNLDGTTNSNFGTSGISNLSRELKSVQNIIASPSGELFVYGESSNNFQPKIVKLNSLGVIDVNFASSGFLQLDFSSYAKNNLNWYSNLNEINDIYVLQDSSFLLTGSYQGHLYVAKVLKNGTLDKDFGKNGIYFENEKVFNGFWLPQADLGTRFNSGRSIIVDSNSIFISAYFNGFPEDANVNTGIIIKPYLIKLNVDGTLDKSFGGIDSLQDVIYFTEGGSSIALDTTINISTEQLIEGASFILKIQSNYNSDILSSNLLSTPQNDVVTINGKPIAGIISNNTNEIIFRIFNNWDIDSLEKFLESITFKSISKNPNVFSTVSFFSKLNSTDASWDFIDSVKININPVNNEPLDQNLSKLIPKTGKYVLNIDDFKFSDPDDLFFSKIKILLTNEINFYFDGFKMPLNSIFSYSDIDKGLISIEVSSVNSSFFEFEIYDSAGKFGNGKLNIQIQDEIKTQSNTLSAILKPGIISSNPELLTAIKETIIYKNNILTTHNVEYKGITYDYFQVDSLITTVTRNGDFTSEFSLEIDNYLGFKSNYTYDAAVKLVGVTNIESVIIFVAGSDGDYVN